MIRALLAALLLTATPALAQQVSTDDQAAIGLAAARGRLIYAYDQAAWHGTDDMAAKLPDYQNRAGGWIVDGPAETPALVFFDRDATDPHALYVAQFRDNKLVSSHVLGPNEDAGLSPVRKRMIAARRAALQRFVADKPLICTDRHLNTVVLPPAGPADPVLVYILTPQPAMNMIPLGGHYRVEVQPDGTAGPLHPFTKACLDLPTDAEGKKGKVAALYVTHLLDPVPTEIHVFSSLAGHIPIAVGTTRNRRSWMVAGSDIRPIDLKREK